MKHLADPDQQGRADTSQKPVVLLSLEDETGLLCVDILKLPSYGYGFREFRRDPEDTYGWRPTGLAHDCVLETRDFALEMACKSVPWLDANEFI